MTKVVHIFSFIFALTLIACGNKDLGSVDKRSPNGETPTTQAINSCLSQAGDKQPMYVQIDSASCEYPKEDGVNKTLQDSYGIKKDGNGVLVETTLHLVLPVPPPDAKDDHPIKKNNEEFLKNFESCQMQIMNVKKSSASTEDDDFKATTQEKNRNARKKQQKQEQQKVQGFKISFPYNTNLEPKTTDHEEAEPLALHTINLESPENKSLWELGINQEPEYTECNTQCDKQIFEKDKSECQISCVNESRTRFCTEITRRFSCWLGLSEPYKASKTQIEKIIAPYCHRQ